MTLFGPEGVVEWMRMLAGIAVFMAPGVAAADRFLPGRKDALLLAPVFSLTLLPLAAILLDHALGVPVHAVTTALLALALTLALASHRVEEWL